MKMEGEEQNNYFHIENLLGVKNYSNNYFRI